MFAVRRSILVGISVVTFDVLSCTKFQIFWGSAPDLTGEVYRRRQRAFRVPRNRAIFSLQVSEKSWNVQCFDVCTNSVNFGNVGLVLCTRYMSWMFIHIVQILICVKFVFINLSLVLIANHSALPTQPYTVLYSVSQKQSPLRFSDIFSKWYAIFRPNFTNLLHISIYAGLQIFIQLCAILTKLFHIKCDHHKMFTIGRNARWHFLTFFQKSWEFLVQILHTYYLFLCTYTANFYPIISNFGKVMPY